jgi:hypothetical protein
VARMKQFSIGYLVFCFPREFSFVHSFPFQENILCVNLFYSLCIKSTLLWARVICLSYIINSCSNTFIREKLIRI